MERVAGDKKMFFSKEPVRRMLIAMTTNQAYLGSNRTNPFHYQQFRLNQVTIYRNGQPIVGTPIATTFNHRIYYNTADALDFLEKMGMVLNYRIMLITSLWHLI